jgi:hypothetical protein
MLTSTSNDVIEVTNSDVDVTVNDVEIPTLRQCRHERRRSKNVDESMTGLASGLIDTDKLNVVMDL